MLITREIIKKHTRSILPKPSTRKYKINIYVLFFPEFLTVCKRKFSNAYDPSVQFNLLFQAYIRGKVLDLTPLPLPRHFLPNRVFISSNLQRPSYLLRPNLVPMSLRTSPTLTPVRKLSQKSSFLLY